MNGHSVVRPFPGPMWLAVGHTSMNMAALDIFPNCKSPQTEFLGGFKDCITRLTSMKYKIKKLIHAFLLLNF